MSSLSLIGTIGMTAASKQMDVIGNNLANSHTLRYKSGDTSYCSIPGRVALAGQTSTRCEFHMSMWIGNSSR